ncbi:hypothetical protein QYF36_019327 [Acer negundo]|nr:hypothetical protein QYF36_019327 [Acer negundo]
MAILKACQLYSSRNDLVNRPLMIISDSKIVVGWVSGNNLMNNSHEQCIGDIRSWLASFSFATVEFRPRSLNSFADTLAKKGLELGIDDIWWSVS